MKIFFLSSDTDHHRYTINYLKKHNIHFEKYIFETTGVRPLFNVKTYYEKNQKKYERKNFFVKLSKNIEKEKILKTKNINNFESYNYIKKLKPDLGVVFGTRKISKKIINLFKFGLINIHRGIVEKYRGLDSEYWALYHRDYKNIGITIHQVSEDLDTGKVIVQRKLKMKKNFKIYMLRYITTVIATKEIVKIIKYFLKNKKFKYSNINPSGRYYSFMPSIIKNNLVLGAKKR